jgi:hypothetical protein
VVHQVLPVLQVVMVHQEHLVLQVVVVHQVQVEQQVLQELQEVVVVLR